MLFLQGRRGGLTTLAVSCFFGVNPIELCVCCLVVDSMLFADVTGLNILSQQCSPSELVHNLNELFSRFDQLATVSSTHNM